jgi:hypothetical protein
VARPARQRATRAISIAATPQTVWRWLIQTGFGRAGFYSNDLLDNAGHPSEHPRVGDWVPMFSKVNDTTAFRFAEIDPPRRLLWVKPTAPGRGGSMRHRTAARGS